MEFVTLDRLIIQNLRYFFETIGCWYHCRSDYAWQSQTDELSSSRMASVISVISEILSSYADTLPNESKCRYIDKITTINGMDPFLLLPDLESKLKSVTCYHIKF